ncbi:hypothetical protein AJ78_06322 [Emergomyces pasteurianus Ep9510]|uniref:Protein kinase domain-containing protein n=1 Tax=Emergomyces pasteurianus Ep9510 TaxID=1447872 RepID=A0A1J9QBB3_9EURO|nr:hypothetical protein AJ78_06322 [Emergomyces pasteurianus Ep9510]
MAEGSKCTWSSNYSVSVFKAIHAVDEYKVFKFEKEAKDSVHFVTSQITKERGEALISGIREIHRALVLHCDAKPRNMIVRNDPDRVVWLDFDRAQTYHAHSLTERQRGFIEDEELMMSQLADSLEADHARGEIVKTYLYYCT